MESKKSGEKQTKGRGRSVGETAGKPDPKIGAERGAKSYPAQPTLDFLHSMMLSGKTDRVEELDCITVKFFPGNMIEVLYEVRKDPQGASIMMTASAFSAFLRERKVEHAKVHEGTEAVGFRNKMLKRLLISTPMDVPGIRRVMALTQPLEAKKIMSYSQKELQAHGMNVPEGVLAFWNKTPSSVKEEMDRYQEFVDPDADPWTHRLDMLTAEASMKRVETEERKAKKALGASAVATGGSSSSVSAGAKSSGKKSLSWAEQEAKDAKKLARLKEEIAKANESKGSASSKVDDSGKTEEEDDAEGEEAL